MNLEADLTELKNRREKLIEKTKEFDFNIIFNRPDMYYYSDTGLDGILTIENDNFIRYVRRNKKLAKEETDIEIKQMDNFRVFKEIGKNNHIETVGLELDLVPYKTVEYIRKSFGNPKIIDISDILRKIRSVKSTYEIKMMKLATKQTDDSFEYIKDKIKPGITELEISAEIEYFLRKEGHPGYVNVRMFHHNLTTLAYVMSGESTATLNIAFGPVSGQGSCKIHKNGPSRRKIKENDSILIDTTGIVNGYTGDETRTFFIGNPAKELRDAYDVARQVQMKASKLLVSGKYANDVYMELNEFVKELGYFDNFMGLKNDKVPFIGHGIGLELDEYPIITSGYKEKLVKNQIIALEPKLIIQKPFGGVGIEDDWIVGESNAEKITQFEYE